MVFNNTKKLLAAALLISLLSSNAMAWTRAGHAVIGAILYDDLKANHPQTLAKLLEILHQHPQWNSFNKKLGTVDPENRDRYLLMIAARWADDIRDDKTLSHPVWHYIDFPITAPGDTTPTEQPAAENAITALTTEVGTLKDTTAKPGDRAIAVCWTEHLIGDVHQPMHAVSMYSAKLPKGDRGGNDTWVQVERTSQTINLHALWDSLVTNSEGYKDAANIAVELRNRPEFSRSALADQLKDMDPNNWVKESGELAFKVAYINGTLVGGTKQKGTLLPTDYGKTAKAAAEKRTILAGYRLADAMVKTLGE